MTHLARVFRAFLLGVLLTATCGEQPAWALKSGKFQNTLQPKRRIAANDPSTIFGSALYGWYRGDSLSLSGSNVTGATDKSSKGNNLSLFSNNPTYSATGGPNSTPVVTHANNADGLIKATPTGAPAIHGTSNIFAVAKATANANGDIARAQGDASFIGFDSSGTVMDIRYCSGSGTSPSFTYGTTFHRWALYTITGHMKFRVDGVTKDDQPFDADLSTGVTEIDVGYNNAQDIWADVAFVSGPVTEAQVTSWDSYVNTRYSL